MAAPIKWAAWVVCALRSFHWLVGFAWIVGFAPDKINQMWLCFHWIMSAQMKSCSKFVELNKNTINQNVFPHFNAQHAVLDQPELHSFVWLLASSFPKSPTPSESVSSIWKIYEHSHHCFCLCNFVYHLVLVYPNIILNVRRHISSYACAVVLFWPEVPQRRSGFP